MAARYDFSLMSAADLTLVQRWLLIDRPDGCALLMVRDP
jgi:hypothetical protein